MSTLEDEVCQTLTDAASEMFCKCSHKNDMHEIGEITKTTKCFGMIYNGISLAKCYCTDFVPITFEIEVDLSANNN